MESLAAVLGVFALLMLISLLSSKLSGIINMPCLLLFLVVGLVAGSDLLGSHKLMIESTEMANAIGTIIMIEETRSPVLTLPDPKRPNTVFCIWNGTPIQAASLTPLKSTMPAIAATI